MVRVRSTCKSNAPTANRPRYTEAVCLCQIGDSDTLSPAVAFLPGLVVVARGYRASRTRGSRGEHVGHVLCLRSLSRVLGFWAPCREGCVRFNGALRPCVCQWVLHPCTLLWAPRASSNQRALRSCIHKRALRFCTRQLIAASVNQHRDANGFTFHIG